MNTQIFRLHEYTKVVCLYSYTLRLIEMTDVLDHSFSFILSSVDSVSLAETVKISSDGPLMYTRPLKA